MEELSVDMPGIYKCKTKKAWKLEMQSDKGCLNEHIPLQFSKIKMSTDSIDLRDVTDGAACFLAIQADATAGRLTRRPEGRVSLRREPRLS